MYAQITHFSKTLNYTLLLVACVFLSACEKTEKYDGVARTLDALVTNPANFCTYVGNNMNMLSSPDFHKCSNEKISYLASQISDKSRLCEGKLPDIRLVLQCEADTGVPGMVVGKEMLQMFNGLSGGSTSCSDLSAYYYNTQQIWDTIVADMNNFGYDYPTWAEFIGGLRGEIYSTYTCKWKHWEFLGKEL